MKIPPTLLPLYKEKPLNHLACVLVQQTKVKEALGWDSGVLDFSHGTTTEWLLLTSGYDFPPMGLFFLVYQMGRWGDHFQHYCSIILWSSYWMIRYAVHQSFPFCLGCQEAPS